MGPIIYALGKWPVKFKRDEMGAAALFCAGNGNAVLDGPGRTEGLGKLEFIGDLVFDVDTLAVIVENRSGKNSVCSPRHKRRQPLFLLVSHAADPWPLLLPFLDGDAPQL